MIRTVEDAAEALAVAQRNGYRVELIVIGVDDTYWSSPGQIIGRNTKTGKGRRFYDRNVIRIKHNPTTHCTARSAGAVLANQMDMRSVTNA